MSRPSSNNPSVRTLGRTILAALILLVAIYFLVHFLFVFAALIAGFVAVVLILGGVLWALRVLLT